VLSVAVDTIDIPTLNELIVTVESTDEVSNSHPLPVCSPPSLAVPSVVDPLRTMLVETTDAVRQYTHMDRLIVCPE
jgi:hypothetical protein